MKNDETTQTPVCECSDPGANGRRGAATGDRSRSGGANDRMLEQAAMDRMVRRQRRWQRPGGRYGGNSVTQGAFYAGLALGLLLACNAPAATVNGKLKDIGLAGLATPLTFTPTNLVLLTTDGLQIGPPKTISAVSTGFSLTLDAGDYWVRAPLVPTRLAFKIAVPDSTNSYNITSLLSAPLSYLYIPPIAGAGTNVIWPIAGTGTTATTNGLTVAINADAQTNANLKGWSAITPTTSYIGYSSGIGTNPLFYGSILLDGPAATPVDCGWISFNTLGEPWYFYPLTNNTMVWSNFDDGGDIFFKPGGQIVASSFVGSGAGLTAIPTNAMDATAYAAFNGGISTNNGTGAGNRFTNATLAGDVVIEGIKASGGVTEMFLYSGTDGIPRHGNISDSFTFSLGTLSLSASPGTINSNNMDAPTKALLGSGGSADGTGLWYTNAALNSMTNSLAIWVPSIATPTFNVTTFGANNATVTNLTLSPDTAVIDYVWTATNVNGTAKWKASTGTGADGQWFTNTESPYGISNALAVKMGGITAGTLNATTFGVNDATITNGLTVTNGITSPGTNTFGVVNATSFNATTMGIGTLTTTNLNIIGVTGSLKGGTNLSGAGFSWDRGQTLEAYTNAILDLSTSGVYRVVTCTTHINFLYATNGPASVTLKIFPNGANRLISWPTNWWVGISGTNWMGVSGGATSVRQAWASNGYVTLLSIMCDTNLGSWATNLAFQTNVMASWSLFTKP